MASVSLTRRASRDLHDIERYSVERWGKAVAEDYLDDIEHGLNRLRENSKLFHTKDGISPDLSLYRVREHFLVCTLSAHRVYVPTIKHGSMDLPRRLAELEPQLLAEAELLRRALDKKHGERLQAVLASLNKKAGVPTGAWFRDYFFFSLSQP